MIFQIAFYLTTQIILALSYLQCTEEPSRRFHFLSFLGKVIVQTIADPPGLGVRKELRVVLRAYQPPKQRDDQRLLDAVLFNMIFHAAISLSQRYVQRHHQAEAYGEEQYANV